MYHAGNKFAAPSWAQIREQELQMWKGHAAPVSKHKKYTSIHCLKEPRALPEPFKLRDRHSTPRCLRDKVLHFPSRPVSIRNGLDGIHPIAMRIKVLGTHFTDSDFNITQVSRGHTCGISDGADDPCSATNELVYHWGRGGLLDLREMRASGRIRSQSVTPFNDTGLLMVEAEEVEELTGIWETY